MDKITINSSEESSARENVFRDSIVKDSNFIDKFSRFIFIVSIFLIPIIFYPNNIHSIFNLKLGLYFFATLLVLLLWSVKSLKSDSFKLPTNLLSISILSLIGTVLISAIFSPNTIVSIFGASLSMLTFVGVLLLFVSSFLISSFFSSKHQSLLLNFAVYLSILVTVLLHLVYVLFDKLFKIPDFGFFVSNSVNTVGKWSDIGILATLLIVLSYLIIETKKETGFMKVLSWIGLVSGGLMVFIVNTSVLWVILGILSIVYLVYKVVDSKKESDLSVRKSIPVIAIVVILLSFMMLLVGNFLSGATNNWFGITFQETKPSFGATIEVMRESISENPVLGFGPNRFEYAWQQFKPLNVNLSNFWGTDFTFGYSYFTSIPTSIGLLGTFAFLFFIAMLLWYSFKLLFARTDNPVSKKNNVTSVFTVFFFIIVFSVHVPSVTVVVLAFVCLGLFLAALSKNNLYGASEIVIESKPKFGFVYIFFVIILMIASVYLSYIVARQFISRIMIENANTTLISGNAAKAERTLINAVNIYSSDQNFRVLSDFYKIQMSSLLSTSDSSDEAVIERFRNLLSSSIQASRNAIAFDNTNYLNFTSLGSTYQQLAGLGVQGAFDQAKAEFNVALEKNPKNPGILLEIARAAFLGKRNEEAKEFIGKALELKSNYTDAAFLLAQIQVAEGDISKAINSVEIALNVDPSNSNLYFQLGLLRYNQAQYDKAVVAFENAVILNPLFSNAKYFLGLSYEREGRRDDAILQFKDLEILNPNNQEVKLILENLEKGKSPFTDAAPPIDDQPESREELPLDDEGAVESVNLEVEDGE